MSSDFWTFDDFAFTKEELVLLFSIKYWALKEEAQQSTSLKFWKKWFMEEQEEHKEIDAYRKSKQKWVTQWGKTVSDLLGIEQLYSKKELVDQIERLKINHRKKSIFVVELATFQPYFKVSSDEHSDLRFDQNDRNIYNRFCSFVVGSENDFIASYNKFDDSVKKISKASIGTNWTLVTAGAGALLLLIAAPYIAAMIGGVMGLSGAAATSAGLALLGGGSVATTGFGMTGGYFFLMTGGAVIGYKTGGSSYKNKFMETSREDLLVSCAKLVSVVTTSTTSQTAKERICREIHAAQYDFEEQADHYFLIDKKDEGEKAHNKATILANTRRFLRGDL